MTDSRSTTPLTAVEADVVRALRGIRFGSVEVIIHDSKIVEIVRKEKLRTEADRTTGGSRRSSE